MSIFDSIKKAIFGHAAVAAPAAAVAAAPAAAATVAPAVAPPAAAPAALTQAVLEAQLTQLSAKNPQKLNWQTSIVDLMKLVGFKLAAGGGGVTSDLKR